MGWRVLDRDVPISEKDPLGIPVLRANRDWRFGQRAVFARDEAARCPTRERRRVAGHQRAVVVEQVGRVLVAGVERVPVGVRLRRIDEEAQRPFVDRPVDAVGGSVGREECAQMFRAGIGRREVEVEGPGGISRLADLVKVRQNPAADKSLRVVRDRERSIGRVDVENDAGGNDAPSGYVVIGKADPRCLPQEFFI